MILVCILEYAFNQVGLVLFNKLLDVLRMYNTEFKVRFKYGYTLKSYSDANYYRLI